MADARTLLKMRLLLSIWIYTVDAIIICAYPIGTGMVFTYGHDATGTDPNGEKELEFKVGYGITMGQNETKAIAMSILDTCLESEDKGFAVNDEEFVLYHIDAVEATGFISHLKLPHYVTFQSKLNSMRKTKKEQADDEKEI